MTEELDILRIIAENPTISQRKIAEQTGISLGQVNFLIKKCAKKGLIKIEGQTTKSLRYNLTPQGVAEKAEKTLKYIKISYAAVIALSDKIRALMKKYKAEGYDIYVYGSRDEMLEITKLALGSECREYLFTPQQIEYINEIYTSSKMGAAIFYWEDSKKISSMTHLTWVNILE